jgi:hypothetical protein
MADKDSRTYIRIHDGMPDHPKVDGLSDAAFRLLVSTWCWCARHLTDGRVPGPTWLKRGTPKSRGELVAAGLADLTEDGEVLMHDYTDHQRTADEVRRISEARREAGKKGGKAKAKAVANAKANGLANGKQNLPIDIDIDIDIDKKNSSATPSGFAEFWSAYPKKVGKPAAEKAWNKAIRDGVDPARLALVAGQYAERTANTDPKFICHPTTWLNQARYNDEPEPETSPVSRRHVPLEVPAHIDPDDYEAYAAWLRSEAK